MAKNREKLYLIFSLAIIAVSGMVIYGLQKNSSIPSGHPDISPQQSQSSAALLNQVSLYKKQLESNPDNYEALVNLGNSYFDLNNPTESVKYYERAIKLRPDVPEVLVDCGVMYRDLGEADKAVDMFTRAMKLAPDLPQAAFNLGAVLLTDKNDRDSALKIWRQFLIDNPNASSDIKSFFQDRIQQVEKAG